MCAWSVSGSWPGLGWGDTRFALWSDTVLEAERGVFGLYAGSLCSAPCRVLVVAGQQPPCTSSWMLRAL